MKNYFIYTSMLLMLASCNYKKDKKKVSPPPTPATPIIAVPMPSTLVSGHKFPTDSTTINHWVENSIVKNNLETNENIITHGWDIWDALTTYTKQKNNEQQLRRFETWYTPGDIKTALKTQTKNSSYKLEHLNRSHTGYLETPHQSAHGIKVEDANVVGFVKCDPSSAEHIYKNELYVFEVLKSMIQSGKIANIPAFPNSSVLIKPVFCPLTKLNSLGKDTYSLPVWPGYQNQVPMNTVIENGFGPSSWNNDITITTKGATNPSQKVFSINDFIHFKLNKEQAENIVNIFNGTHKREAKEGDYAVLVGMHVNTRENKRWTWQTFWWSENPETPQSPSSPLIANHKPKNLDNAANHYAMALAYNMVSPAQPYTGGTNALTKEEPKKESIYAFNPYLEAGFNADTFDLAASPTSKKSRSNSGANDSIRKYYSEGYQKVGAVSISDKVYEGGKLNRVGIETNCMSCHGQARLYDVPSIEDAFQYYATDQYYDMEAPYFKNTVVLDFAWSIQGNLIARDDLNK